jgi:hypothetical protein
MVPDAIMESTSHAAKKTGILRDGELTAVA